MDELDALTVAFLEAHPQEAAQEIGQLNAADAVALLARAPARVMAPVLAAMAPSVAARTLTALDAERSGLVLGAMGTTALAAMLRHVDPAPRSALLERLPMATSLACRALLRYPDDAVGACAQTQLLSLGREARVVQALEAMRQEPAACAGVFVVGPAQTLLGWVPAARLVQADPGLPLSSLMQDLPRLPALMPVNTVLQDPAHVDLVLGAVVERGDRLVGTVTLEALRRLQRATPAAGPDAGHGSSDTAMSLLGHSYWAAVRVLVQAAVAALFNPAPRPPRL
jgi:magnesium transporter